MKYLENDKNSHFYLSDEFVPRSHRAQYYTSVSLTQVNDSPVIN